MRKVLIVEDEEIIRRGLVYTIDWLSMGLTVIGAAADGREGLALIKKHEPDLVITDIIMPVMNGMEMLAAARESKLPSFNSIILTSYAEFSYARQAVKLDVCDYLLKPIDEDELKKVVGGLFGEAVQAAEGDGALSKVPVEFYQEINPVKNGYVKEAVAKVKACYHEKISIESIADELQISASYLSRKFKEVTAQTFLEFLTKYRIQKAIALLSEGKYRVYEVSEMTGLGEYKHFCTVFKKYTGYSPTEFIKNAGALKSGDERERHDKR